MTTGNLRVLLLCLGVAVLGTGCETGLDIGIGTRCAAEKRGVRQRMGQPDRVEEGTRSEFWVYNSSRTTYEFSWDASGESCVVRTGRFQKLPLDP